MRIDFHLIVIFVCLFVTGLSGVAGGQIIGGDNYELRAAPDLWYNSVDGIIVGIRFRGEDPRTFLDGNHRLYAGLRLGTRFPASPLSYHISYAHPVPAITDVNGEGGLRLMSSIRTGLHHHEAGLQKRHQPGFDEFITSDYQIFTGIYRRFDHDYLLYESLWQEDPVFYLRSGYRKRDRNSMGRWTISITGLGGVPVGSGEFTDFNGNESAMPELFGVRGLFGKFDMEALQQIALPAGMFFRTRLFGGISSAALPPEQRYLPSDAAAFDWTRSGFTRARGTIPESWMKAGWVQIPGGPGLRGYTFRTTDQLENDISAWVRHALTYSLEFYYPNPIDSYFFKIPYIGKFLRLESYFFTDAGLLHERNDWQELQMDAGMGFMLTLNIPDYLGQDRGFFIRYELPFWVSNVPDGEDSLKFRHLAGLGAQIRF